MASNKPSAAGAAEAKEFRDWLAGDVVPAIADTGGYPKFG
jgi:prophage antirepressor-like protein